MSSLAMQPAPPAAERPAQAASAARDRVTALGKFLFAGQTKYWLRGIRYRPPVHFGRAAAASPCACTQEALFQLQLREAGAGVRSCSSSDAGVQGGHVGSTPPTADELQHMRAARQAARELSEAKRHDAAAHR